MPFFLLVRGVGVEGLQLVRTYLKSLVVDLQVPCSSLCCFQPPCSWFKRTL